VLKIKNLSASVEGHPILKNLNFEVKPGQVHAIMGPNGSGKSTLAKVVAGHPTYEVTGGGIDYEINFEEKDLLDMEPEERALEGIFLGFQYPTEIAGVSNLTFLQIAYNALARHQGFPEMEEKEFKQLVQKKTTELGLNDFFMTRELNSGFSGGEKKKNELLQMAVLSPRIAILDEIDSGLDIDALKTVAEGVNAMRSPDRSIIIVTHYQRLLNFIPPDFVHIFSDGKIVETGGIELAERLESEGYEGVTH